MSFVQSLLTIVTLAYVLLGCAREETQYAQLSEADIDYRISVLNLLDVSSVKLIESLSKSEASIGRDVNAALDKGYMVSLDLKQKPDLSYDDSILSVSLLSSDSNNSILKYFHVKLNKRLFNRVGRKAKFNGAIKDFEVVSRTKIHENKLKIPEYLK